MSNQSESEGLLRVVGSLERGGTLLDVAHGGCFGARGNAVFVLLTPVVFAWTRVGRRSSGPSKSQKSFSSQKQLIPEKGSVRNPLFSVL
ncbi:hypothetical protein [Paenibacillus sp. PDC88]|uniref:hypothetical protein n=1 Tax=Paenibacillus sp. PDC88 TaxID=1884375 RepID=UPI00115FA77E|nr:hypothetical protein [Paenibacillus sp. PDC88]